MYCPFCGDKDFYLIDAFYGVFEDSLRGGLYYCYKCRKEIKIEFNPNQVDFVKNKNIDIEIRYNEPN